MIMFHAVVKFMDKCAGRTSLKKQLGVYVSLQQKKFKVIINDICFWNFFCVHLIAYLHVTCFLCNQYLFI